MPLDMVKAEKREDKRREKSRLKKGFNHDLVMCCECGKRFVNITFHLKTKHKMTVDGYREKYGEDKEIVSESFKKMTADRVSSGSMPKVSRVQIFMYENILKYMQEFHVELEFREKYYVIDIAFPEKKLAVEVDGDYWHNKEGLPIEQLNKSQIRTITNDRAKEQFLKNRGWRILRFWESDIASDLSKCIEVIAREAGKEVSVPKINYEDLYRGRQKVCAKCGKEFTYHQVLNKRKFCSRDCQNRDKTIYGVVKRICKDCGKEYKTHNSGNKSFCDAVCQKSYERKHAKERGIKAAKSIENSDYNIKRRREGRVYLVCDCGKRFWTHRRSMKIQTKKYCSRECYFKYHERFRRNHESSHR